MHVTGFSFIKNAIKYDFPVVEALHSILPLCDEIIVAVGDSDDDTRQLIHEMDDKISIIDTVWDETLLNDGAVLADETNKALRAINSRTDWCIYIQGDEVLHQDDHDTILEAMSEYQYDEDVQGLLFNYRHFYGSYDYVGSSSKWYRREIRAFKYHHDVFSYKDAQGFRIRPNEKLRVKAIPAYVYHYGWVKPPEIMYQKVKNDRLVRHGMDESGIPLVHGSKDDFDFSQIDQLKRFDGTHPKYMSDRIAQNNWKFDYDITMNRLTLKERIKQFSQKLLGHAIGEYRNYILLK